MARSAKTDDQAAPGGNTVQAEPLASTRAPATSATGVIDLFAGIGCVADGFAARGFEPLALVDVDADARRTYVHNHPDANYLLRDVAQLTAADVVEMVGDAAVGGVVGCPPCQGFSAAGARKADDPRNRLLAAFFAAIDLFAPLFFVMENVPSVVYQPELVRLLEERGEEWATCIGVLNSACYGLPQTRERAIVIGYRRELEVEPTLPPPTHFGRRPVFNYRAKKLALPSVDFVEALLGAPPHIGVPREKRVEMAALLPADATALLDLVTVGDAIGDLRPLVNAGFAADPSAYAAGLRHDGEPTNHEAWRHRPEMVAKLTAVVEGGRLETERRYYSQAYGRLHRDGLARTITTNFHNAGCGRFTHYVEPRTLTVREAARLQGIRDSFEFVGDRSLQERLVGNAFPRPWAEAIASHVAAQLNGTLAAV